MVTSVRAEIEDLLASRSGVCSRAELLSVLSRNELDDEVRRGQLVRLGPRAFARPWEQDVLASRELAALKSTGGDCALSHLTALRRWSIAVAPSSPIHVTAMATQRPRSSKEVVVHRTRLPIRSAPVGGAKTVLPAWAIVGSWPLLPSADRRAPAIVSVRRRLVTVAELVDVVDQHTRLPGRADLLRLLTLIEAGCQSELELWGYTKVFGVPELRGALRQRAIVVRGKTYVLDMAFEAEKVVVELDGRAYHASATQWERDIARDLALATVGWLTIRLSHRRLTTDIDGCRRDVLRVLHSRR
jgi:very-short-patch-repair endonuclease